MLNILIPAAGAGRRFVEAGYKESKPFIDVLGKPMLQRVIDNVRPAEAHRFHIILRRDAVPPSVMGFYDSHMLLTDGVTEGAACTALLAKGYLDNDSPLIIANSDQLLDWNVDDFLVAAEGSEGSIVTFTASDPKWSYVQTSQSGSVVRVVEKAVISDQATCGVYYWARGADFVRCAERMIAKDIRTNGEFYLAPSYNELIAEGGLVTTYRVPVEVMHGLGTPEDLQAYLASQSVAV